MTPWGSAGRVASAASFTVIAGGVAWGAYLNVVGLAAAWSLRATRGQGRKGPGTMRFRVLVPAHDEEAMIGETLDSLGQLDYPDHMVEIHVVADNCRDETAAVARSHGVHVHIRDDPNRPGKGEALAWLIDRLPHRSHGDAVVVIDADTVVHRDLLNAFERAFARGSAAVQGHYKVKGAAAGGEVGFRAVAFAVRHLARPAGRTALGGSSSLYGNGMAIRESTARNYRWSSDLTEDLEMGLRLLLDGHHVAFAADAVIEAEMPASLEDSDSQHERWEAGRIQVAREFVPQLVRAARARAHGHRWRYVDAAIDISLPPLTTVVAATATAGAATTGLARGHRRWIGVAGAGAGLGLQASHVLHSMRMAEVPPEARRSLIRTPAHILWKSRLMARVARRRPGTWVKTARGTRRVAA